jgi:hypothetical protein
MSGVMANPNRRAASRSLKEYLIIKSSSVSLKKIVLGIVFHLGSIQVTTP